MRSQTLICAENIAKEVNAARAAEHHRKPPRDERAAHRDLIRSIAHKGIEPPQIVPPDIGSMAPAWVYKLRATFDRIVDALYYAMVATAIGVGIYSSLLCLHDGYFEGRPTLISAQAHP